MMNYAVIEFKGFEYRVKENGVITVQKVDKKEGENVEIDTVLLVRKGDKTLVGTPYVEGAKVIAKVLGDRKTPKVIAFKFKRRKNYRRKKGHRQILTELKIEKIIS